MATNTNRLTYRQITESDNWSSVVDKVNYNFDQTKAFGGGDKGDHGDDGKRGLPGATGIGKQGNKGDKGATINFVQVALVDGGPVTDPTTNVGDVVIDSNGSFFKVITNNIGNLVYKFQYSLASALTGSIVETENQVASQSTNPIIKWYLRSTGNPRDANALFVDRVIGTVSDDAQMYRAVIGDSGYPLLQNSALVLVNILPSVAATSAKSQFFAQVAFKYRSGSNTNVSSNTGYLRYFELNKNEATPAGADDTYMTMDNISGGFGVIHDSLTTDASYALVRGKNVRFMGKTAMDQFYNNGSINNSGPFLDLAIDTVVAFNTQKAFSITSGDQIQFVAATSILGNAQKMFSKGALYVGADNFSAGNSYAPANGAVIEGAVGIGLTAAPNVNNSVMLHVAGNAYIQGQAIILNDNGAADLDHIWFDDRNDIAGVGGLYHLVADAPYKNIGNAGLQAGRYFGNRADIVDRLIIGAAGWTSGLAGGLSVQGQSEFGGAIQADAAINALDRVIIGPSAWTSGNANGLSVYGQSRFKGLATFEGATLDIGVNGDGQTYHTVNHWNPVNARYEFLGYRADGSVNDWRLSYNNNEYKLWHGGNMGAGSGLNADLLDGIDSLGYVRFGVRSDGDYVWIRDTNTSGALMVTQQTSGARIQRWFAGSNDGTEKAYIDFGGTMYAQDFYILGSTSNGSVANQLSAMAAKTQQSGLSVNNGTNVDLRSLDSGIAGSKIYGPLVVNKGDLGGASYNYKLKIVGWMSGKRDSGSQENMTLNLEISTNGSSYALVRSFTYGIDGADTFPMVVSGSYNMTSSTIWIRLNAVDNGSSMQFSSGYSLEVDVINTY